MNIQLLISSRHGPKVVDLSQKKNQLAIAVVILLAASLLLLSGYFLTRYFVPVRGESDIGKWYTSLLLKEREGVKQISEQMTNDINSLALNIGRIEARSIRLDALGSRLAMLAGLGDDEFDFTITPAVGGPEDNVSAVSSRLPDLVDRFTQLQRHMDDRQNKLLLLESILMDRELREQAFPSGRPVKNGWLSSRYGKRIDPFSGKTSWHEGVDFAGKMGSDVVSSASGIVTWAGNKYGFGLLVEITHGNGYLTRYAHNSELVVKIGDKVRRGEVIAKMGSTGRSTGPHVHFEILKDGKAVNPSTHILSVRKIH